MTSLEPDTLPPVEGGPLDDGPSLPALVPGQLTDAWRWVFTVGWSLIVPALMVLGDAAHSLGKPTWWLDRGSTASWWSPLPFLLPIGAALAGAFNWRRWPLAATAAVASLIGCALVDVGRVPAVGVCEGILAGAGLCTTLAALVGRVQLPRN